MLSPDQTTLGLVDSVRPHDDRLPLSAPFSLLPSSMEVEGQHLGKIILGLEILRSTAWLSNCV